MLVYAMMFFCFDFFSVAVRQKCSLMDVLGVSVTHTVRVFSVRLKDTAFAIVRTDGDVTIARYVNCFLHLI